MDIEKIVIIVAGGIFGVILGRLLDSSPDWAFWAVLGVFFVAMLYLLTGEAARG